MGATDFMTQMAVVKETGKFVTEAPDPRGSAASSARAAYRRALEAALRLATTDGEREMIEGLLKADWKAQL